MHESIGGRPNSKVLLCLGENQLQLCKWNQNKQFQADINVSKWVFVRNGASKYSSTCLTSRMGFIDGFNGKE